MSNDSTVSDLEFRIAFLEDQIDALNREVVSLNRDRDKLTEELQALAHLIRPTDCANVLSRGAPTTPLHRHTIREKNYE